jgi:hypothetical protein
MKRNGAGWQPERPFLPLPLSVMESAAWNTLVIDHPHATRLILFLVREWTRHKGQKNGFLFAPRRQLLQFGIGAHFISKAIIEAERLGLIDVTHGAGRAPNRYALTWLPINGETEPSNRWQHYQEENRCKIVKFATSASRSSTIGALVLAPPAH